MSEAEKRTFPDWSTASEPGRVTVNAALERVGEPNIAGRLV
jgi:hypothetical protein